MNKNERRVKSKTEEGNMIKTLDANKRLHAYHFLRSFEFGAREIIMLYQIATGDVQMEETNRNMLEELVNWYKVNRYINDIPKLAATFFHLFVTSRPFVKNNLYMAQILMNTILIKHGHPPVIIPMEKRMEYLGRCFANDETSIASVEELIKGKIGQDITGTRIGKKIKYMGAYGE